MTKDERSLVLEAARALRQCMPSLSGLEARGARGLAERLERAAKPKVRAKPKPGNVVQIGSPRQVA